MYVEAKEEGKLKAIDFLRNALWSYMPLLNILWVIGTIVYMVVYVVEVAFLNRYEEDK